MLPRALTVGPRFAVVGAQDGLVQGRVSWRMVVVRRQHNTPLKLTAHVTVFDFSPVCRSLAAPR
jgi:hypothetical protein